MTNGKDKVEIFENHCSKGVVWWSFTAKRGKEVYTEQ